ncbi:MAG: division/cell wall cluster transcriptional repressor MraZ [Alphaproteobacteria bacterium]
MALFTGHVVNKVDRKGRVSVPASFRNELAKLSFPGIIVFPSPEGLPAIDGAGIDWLENLSANFGTANPFALKLPKSRMALFGQVERLSFDPEGRVILTRGLMEHAGINDSAAFIGMGETFQIWQPEAGASVLGDAIAGASAEFDSLARNGSPEGDR